LFVAAVFCQTSKLLKLPTLRLQFPPPLPPLWPTALKLKLWILLSMNLRIDISMTTSILLRFIGM
jgi:hypothetical protein